MKRQQEEIKAIIFDIGGVIVENPKYKEFWNNIDGSAKLREDFGTRRITTKEFIREGSRLLNISQKQFLKEYKESYWTGELIYSVFNIFKSIKIKKYILSDTNPLHQQYLKRRFPEIFKLSNKVFLNLRKSNPKSLKVVIKRIKLSPNHIIFIDDKKEIVTLARSLGINAILFGNPKELKKELFNFGVKI